MPDPFKKTVTLEEHAGDVDESWDSLHHTVGAGPTQAAAGNHTHKEYMVIGSAPGTSGDFVKKSGDTMTGPLQLNASMVDGKSAANVNWVHANSDHGISGPHGPNPQSYLNVSPTNAYIPGTGLIFPAQAQAGTWRVTVSAYINLQATGTNSGNIYLTVGGYWSDSVPMDWRNTVAIIIGRAHVTGAETQERAAIMCQGYITNRPGYNLSLQPMASYDGTLTVAQIGFIRFSMEYIPNTYELGQMVGWTNI